MDALNVLCAPLTRDLFAIAKFLLHTKLDGVGGNSHNESVECRWGKQKSRSEPISGFNACC